MGFCAAASVCSEPLCSIVLGCLRTFPAFNSPLLSVMFVARRAAGCAILATEIMTHNAMTAPRDAVMPRLPLHRASSVLRTLCTQERCLGALCSHLSTC